MIIAITPLSTRQLRIIELLLVHHYEVTVAFIAENLGISSRTVHRELIIIEDYLHNFDIKLQKKSGLGIKLIGSNAQTDKLHQMLKQKQPSEMSTEERRTIILCTLLSLHEPIKLFSLAHDLSVTMPTIGYDLDELEPMIGLHELHLIRKRGYGVELTGYEGHKRKLISSLVWAHLDNSQIINYTDAVDSYSNQPAIQHLVKLLGTNIYQRIEAAIWSWQESGKLKLSEDSYTNLVLHISIGIHRYWNGHPLPKQRSTWGKPTPNAELLESMERFNELIQLLMTKLNVQLPQEEINYIVNLIYQAVNDDEEINLFQDQQQLKTIITKLSEEITKQTNEDITEDISLVDGLIKHMIPTLKRIREGSAIRNPMLPHIKKEYSALFNMIHHSIKKLMPHIHIPEEEIGYITMHYGAAIERLKQLPKKLNAVLVCTSGIGSSKMLAVRLNKLFPQINQTGHYSWYEAARLPKDNYDFIISTVDLPIDADQYIKLSPLVTDEEMMKLKQFIKNHVSLTTTKQPNPTYSSNSELWFQELKHHTQAVIDVMNAFETIELPISQDTHSTSVHDLLPDIIHAIKQQDRITDPSRVVDQLFIREQQGSIVLPDSEIALLHTRDSAIKAPIVAIFHLNETVYINHKERDKVKHLLLMLAPKQLDKYMLDILSEISSMLLVPQFVSLIQSNSIEIKSYISTQLEKRMREKLDWRE